MSIKNYANTQGMKVEGKQMMSFSRLIETVCKKLKLTYEDTDEGDNRYIKFKGKASPDDVINILKNTISHGGGSGIWLNGEKLGIYIGGFSGGFYPSSTK